MLRRGSVGIGRGDQGVDQDAWKMYWRSPLCSRRWMVESVTFVLLAYVVLGLMHAHKYKRWMLTSMNELA